MLPRKKKPVPHSFKVEYRSKFIEENGFASKIPLPAGQNVNNLFTKMRNTHCFSHKNMNANYFCDNDDCIRHNQAFMCSDCANAHTSKYGTGHNLLPTKELFSTNLLNEMDQSVLRDYREECETIRNHQSLFDDIKATFKNFENSLAALMNTLKDEVIKQMTTNGELEKLVNANQAFENTLLRYSMDPSNGTLSKYAKAFQATASKFKSENQTTTARKKISFNVNSILENLDVKIIQWKEKFKAELELIPAPPLVPRPPNQNIQYIGGNNVLVSYFQSLIPVYRPLEPVKYQIKHNRVKHSFGQHLPIKKLKCIKKFPLRCQNEVVPLFNGSYLFYLQSVGGAFVGVQTHINFYSVYHNKNLKRRGAEKRRGYLHGESWFAEDTLAKFSENKYVVTVELPKQLCAVLIYAYPEKLLAYYEHPQGLLETVKPLSDNSLVVGFDGGMIYYFHSVNEVQSMKLPTNRCLKKIETLSDNVLAVLDEKVYIVTAEPFEVKMLISDPHEYVLDFVVHQEDKIITLHDLGALKIYLWKECREIFVAPPPVCLSSLLHKNFNDLDARLGHLRFYADTILMVSTRLSVLFYDLEKRLWLNDFISQDLSLRSSPKAYQLDEERFEEELTSSSSRVTNATEENVSIIEMKISNVTDLLTIKTESLPNKKVDCSNSSNVDTLPPNFLGIYEKMKASVPTQLLNNEKEGLPQKINAGTEASESKSKKEVLAQGEEETKLDIRLAKEATSGKSGVLLGEPKLTEGAFFSNSKISNQSNSGGGLFGGGIGQLKQTGGKVFSNFDQPNQNVIVGGNRQTGQAGGFSFGNATQSNQNNSGEEIFGRTSQTGGGDGGEGVFSSTNPTANGSNVNTTNTGNPTGVNSGQLPFHPVQNNNQPPFQNNQQQMVIRPGIFGSPREPEIHMKFLEIMADGSILISYKQNDQINKMAIWGSE
jgi:hypothetical protein